MYGACEGEEGVIMAHMSGLRDLFIGSANPTIVVPTLSLIQ